MGWIMGVMSPQLHLSMVEVATASWISNQLQDWFAHSLRTLKAESHHGPRRNRIFWSIRRGKQLSLSCPLNGLSSDLLKCGRSLPRTGWLCLARNTRSKKTSQTLEIDSFDSIRWRRCWCWWRARLQSGRAGSLGKHFGSLASARFQRVSWWRFPAVLGRISQRSFLLPLQRLHWSQSIAAVGFPQKASNHWGLELCLLQRSRVELFHGDERSRSWLS